MRAAFMAEVARLAAEDPRVVFVTGDLGFGVVEDFQRSFPDQFVNAGVAEQNMTGLAAGLASCGRVVFTYSIANFPTIRALEQVRNDVCYHDLDVKIVAIGGGMAYGSLGYSHHAIEDLAIMRALPNMKVVAPGDPVEARAATRALAGMPGPAYLRLGRSGEPTVHGEDVPFEIGKAICVRPGSDVTLISTGGMLTVAVEAAQLCAAADIDVRVLSMHTVKPLDVDAIAHAVRETRLIVSLEEHSLAGGLGGAIAEAMADNNLSTRLLRLGLPSEPTYAVGSDEYLRDHYGLAAETIARRIGQAL